MFRRRSQDEPAIPPAGDGQASAKAEPAAAALLRPTPLRKEEPPMALMPTKPTPAAAPAAPTPTAAPMAPSLRPAPEAPRAAARTADRRTLVVGRGISLAGTITDCERLVVEGTVEASLHNGSELTIAAGGTFKGEIEIDEADVSGTFDGALVTRSALVVRASGRVLGNVRCRRLTVEEGGQISGRIEMIAEPVAAPAPAPRTGGFAPLPDSPPPALREAAAAG